LAKWNIRKSNTSSFFKGLLPWGNMSFEKWMQFDEIGGMLCIEI
jgi:hypothetical protein